jgi:hypothetical protein
MITIAFNGVGVVLGTATWALPLSGWAQMAAIAAIFVPIDAYPYQVQGHTQTLNGRANQNAWQNTPQAFYRAKEAFQTIAAWEAMVGNLGSKFRDDIAEEGAFFGVGRYIRAVSEAPMEWETAISGILKLLNCTSIEVEVKLPAHADSIEVALRFPDPRLKFKYIPLWP